jgi:chaperonin cofactor prefoldin
MTLQKKYADLDIKLNRLHSQKSALQQKIKQRENSFVECCKPAIFQNWRRRNHRSDPHVH